MLVWLFIIGGVLYLFGLFDKKVVSETKNQNSTTNEYIRINFTKSKSTSSIIYSNTISYIEFHEDWILVFCSNSFIFSGKYDIVGNSVDESRNPLTLLVNQYDKQFYLSINSNKTSAKLFDNNLDGLLFKQ